MRALAELQDAKAVSDYESAGVAVQTIADIEAQKANVVALYQQYIASQTPPAPPPPLTAEELAAKPAEKMDWNDGLAISRNSKYGRDLDHSDPNVQRAYAEIAARRARGE
jgi:hypothetical protein